MCRLAAYIGPEILISSLVTEPKHSIINQSYKAKEREEPLNGDGFGISWFVRGVCDEPAIFKEVSPAWNNANLRNLARVTKSSCIFAHVRAATVGGHISRSNCHPFSYKNLAFMHNGTIFGFEKICRKLRERLSDESYSWIQGTTDTEHIFALYIDFINQSMTMVEALVNTIYTLENLKRDLGVDSPSTLNLVVSDGKTLVASKYASQGFANNTLYYHKGNQYHCENGICYMEQGGQNSAVLIASEPLSQEQGWTAIKNNSVIIVDENKNIELRDL